MKKPSDFETACAWVLGSEGKYVNHPKDPGGATNYGVTQRNYNAFRRSQHQAERSVRGIEADEVSLIYKGYWDQVRGDDLPSGLNYAMFDFAINSGSAKPIKVLQRILGVRVDGVIGPVTLSRVVEADEFTLIERLCQDRMAYLKGLHHWKTFKVGWTIRVMGEQAGQQDGDLGVIDRAAALARGAAQGLPAPRPVMGRAEPELRSSPAQSTTIQAAAATILTSGAGAVGAFSQLDGRVQIVALVVVGVSVLSGLWILRQRLQKWADGWQ